MQNIIHSVLIVYFKKVFKEFIDNNKDYLNQRKKIWIINPLTSPGEEVTVFTSPYLSAGAPALGEAKGLIIEIFFP